ncbi:MAG TPA: DUF1045 domain-containing protein [Albitalea sp.]|nr:DUF1045 domain-containing protein [Albitalea sp.]
MSTAPRYALYWAPPREHPLWRAGCDWLGRDPERDQPCAAPRPHTSEPRRYGLHATLKPPMSLADGVDEVKLLARVREIAAEQSAFEMPPLAVETLHRFVALRPTVPIAAGHPLRRLADAFVLGLEPCRRPLTPSQIEQRLRAGLLDAERIENVRRFGYAHVLDHWRFHVTLSDSFAEGAAGDIARAAVWRDASAFFAEPLAQPLRCDAVALFVESSPGAPFELRQRVPLGVSGR